EGGRDSIVEPLRRGELIGHPLRRCCWRNERNLRYDPAIGVGKRGWCANPVIDRVGLVVEGLVGSQGRNLEEDAISAAHTGLPLTERIPGEPETRRPLVPPVGRDATPNSRIAGEHQTSGRSREYRGLLARTKGDLTVVLIHDLEIGLVTYTEVQCEARRQL